MRNLFPVLAVALAILSLALTFAWSGEVAKTRAEKERVAAITAEKEKTLDVVIKAYAEADRNWARARDLRAALNGLGYDLPEAEPVPSN